jgi:hypothetical protein
MDRWLKSTKYNDCNSEIVQTTLKEILSNTPSSSSDREKAVLIYNFVRDEIKFGFDKKFYEYTASEVLKSRISFCNPKGTLFCTLLRAANIPARQHFVGINMKILDGAGDITRFAAYGDHCYSEVWLDEKWVKLDGYVVDSVMYRNSRKLLNDSVDKKTIGWGIHTDGDIEWDGKNDVFVMCVQNQKFPEIINHDFGVYDDIEAFYESGKGLGKRTYASSLLFRLVVGDLNNKVNAVRNLKAN